MKPEEFPKVITDSLAAHEGFRRLGFLPKDIYLIVNYGRVFVVLKQDGKEFSWLIGSLEKGTNYMEFRELWNKAVEHWNGVWGEEECQRIFENGPVSNNSFDLLLALRRKGFMWHHHGS